MSNSGLSAKAQQGFDDGFAADRTWDASSLWVSCAVGQLLGAVACYQRGHGGSSMPFRAFCIASLMIGAGACAVGGALHAAGIRQLHDLKQVGNPVRDALGAPPKRD